MSSQPDRLPQDRWLIQEALKRIPQGNEVFMEWVKENESSFDQLFFNFLRKTVEFSEKKGPESSFKAFQFLEKCLHKVFRPEEALGIIAVSDDNYQELWNKGSSFLHKGLCRPAIQIFQALETFFVAHNKQNFFESLYSNLGISYAQLRDAQKAVDYLEKALSLAKTVENQEKILSNLGTVYHEAQKYDKAISFHEKALLIAEERKDIVLQIRHWNNIILGQIETGAIPLAIENQEKTLLLAQEISDQKAETDSLTRLGVLHTMLGDPKTANDFCEKALILSQQEKN